MRDVVTVAATSTEAMSTDDRDAATLRLPASEQQRASGIGFDRRRRAFVVGRLLLRSTAARIAGVEPREVGIELEPSGRPVLTGDLSRYFVSIAHSGCHVVVGVAKTRIGVDVEQFRQTPPSPRLMARVCSPDELNALEAMADPARAAAFISVWVRKEAYGKATGRGLDFALLRSVIVGVRGADGPSGVGSVGGWGLADLDVDPSCAAAVVAEGRDWHLQLDRVDRRSL